jgi:hypothetical protein
VLAYLARYTHRVAISNRRLIAADEKTVTFTFKDYRIEGPGRYKTMTLYTAEFIRRFLVHVLPKGFHRIRHYGLFASTVRAQNLATMRTLIALLSLLPQVNEAPQSQTPSEEAERCPKCGGRMRVILRFEGACRRRKTAPVPARFDTS